MLVPSRRTCFDLKLVTKSVRKGLDSYTVSKDRSEFQDLVYIRTVQDTE